MRGQLNDAFRRSDDGGRILFTAGVSALGVIFAHHALALVRRFDAFTEGNDPHGEHDFGSFTHQGHSVSAARLDAFARGGGEFDMPRGYTGVTVKGMATPKVRIPNNWGPRGEGA